MSEETTKETPDSRSFEERVFARFDALDARMSSMEARQVAFEEKVDHRFEAAQLKLRVIEDRIGSLEEKVDARLQETRPIWESVIARLDKIENEIKRLTRRMQISHEDFMDMKEHHLYLEQRIEKLEEAPTS